MLFKFWRWRVRIKVEKLECDAKIEYLANELIRAMQDSGRQVAMPEISTGYGSVDINVYNMNTEKESGRIYYQGCKKSIDFKPSFGKLKVFG